MKPLVAPPAANLKKFELEADSYEEDYSNTFRSGTAAAAGSKGNNSKRKPSLPVPSTVHIKPPQNKPSSDLPPKQSDDDYENDFDDTEQLLEQTVKPKPIPAKESTPLRNMPPQALLMSGNSDQNAASDEYQEINDQELEAYERKHGSKNPPSKVSSKQATLEAKR